MNGKIQRILNKCRKGEHELVDIIFTAGYELDTVVRWCKNCGVIVADLEYDNRLYEPGGHFKMTNCELTKEVYKTQRR